MIVETQSEFIEFLKEYKDNDVIIIPILLNDKKHIINNELCCLFIKILNKNSYYILPFNHIDADPLNLNILKYLNLDNKKYVIDKKQFLNIYNFKNLIDINILHYLEYNIPIIIDLKHQLNHFFNKFDGNCNYIPLLKISDFYLKYSFKLEEHINKLESYCNESSFKFLNDLTIESLHTIEKNGLYINPDIILEHFSHYDMHISNSLIYTNYNVYTLTGRPSNRFANLNFAALNKDSGIRDSIISRFGDSGKLIYFDYDAYHLNLIANLIDYKFPENTSVHQYLGKYYFNKEQLNDIEYAESKAVSFNILYGGIHESIAKEVPFFDKAKKYIIEMWNKFENNGFIESEVSRKKFYKKNFDDINSNKLFNYYLQNYETERNMLIISKLNTLLKEYKSKLILYLYDGFLIDFNQLDEISLIKEIHSIITEKNKFKVKTYYGNSFGNLIKIE